MGTNTHALLGTSAQQGFRHHCAVLRARIRTRRLVGLARLALLVSTAWKLRCGLRTVQQATSVLLGRLIPRSSHALRALTTITCVSPVRVNARSAQQANTVQLQASWNQQDSALLGISVVLAVTTTHQPRAFHWAMRATLAYHRAISRQ